MKLCPTCGDPPPESLTACPKDGTDLIVVRENAAAREAAMIGKTIDRRYVIQERLGAGGIAMREQSAPIVATAVSPSRSLAMLPDSVDVPVGARLRITLTADGHEPLERELIVEAPLALSLGLVRLPIPAPSAPATTAAAPSAAPRPAAIAARRSAQNSPPSPRRRCSRSRRRLPPRPPSAASTT